MNECKHTHMRCLFLSLASLLAHTRIYDEIVHMVRGLQVQCEQTQHSLSLSFSLYVSLSVFLSLSLSLSHTRTHTHTHTHTDGAHKYAAVGGMEQSHTLSLFLCLSVFYTHTHTHKQMAYMCSRLRVEWKHAYQWLLKMGFIEWRDGDPSPDPSSSVLPHPPTRPHPVSCSVFWQS